MKRSIVRENSFQFAVSIVHGCQTLQGQNEFVLRKQLPRSGKSIGAHVREASQASSKKDFIHKMNIVLKEAVETQYWIELLGATEYLSKEEANNLHRGCPELCKYLLPWSKQPKVILKSIDNYALSTVHFQLLIANYSL